MAFIIGGTAGAIVGTGLLSAGTGLIGAGMQSSAAKDAAEIQKQSADSATNLQRDIYNQNRSDNEPWRQTGMRALSDLGNADFQRDFTAADFTKDPGYDFRMAEGQKALERSAAARGGLQSGGTLKALSKYGQNFASNEYQNAYNRFNQDRDRRFGRLSSLAGIGQTANSQNAAGASNYANASGEIGMNNANAQANAGIASANAWGNALSGMGKNAMDGYWMDRSIKAFGKEGT